MGIANGESASTARAKINAVLDRNVYLDSIAGNDSNSGFSPSLPKQTAAGAAAVLADGGTLFVARNSAVYRGNFGGKRHLTVRPYGDGRRPIFTAAKSISSGAWSNVSGEIWLATVTHDVPTENATGEGMQFAIWVDEGGTWERGATVGLRRRTDSGTRAAALAALQRGEFFVRAVGSPDSNPVTATGLTQLEYYVRLKDGTAPNATTLRGRTIRYGEATGCASFGFGSDVEGVDFMRSSSKDHVGGGSDLPGAVGRFHDCRFIDFHTHGTVARACNYTECYFEGNGAAPVPFSGSTLHLYRARELDGYSRGAWVDKCVFRHCCNGIAVHGSAGDTTPSGWTHEQWEIGEITMYDVSSGISAVSLAPTEIRVKKLHIYGGQGALAANTTYMNGPNGGRFVVDDFVFVARPNGQTSYTNEARAIQCNATIKRGWVYIDHNLPLTSTSRCLIGVRALANGAQIVLENVTSIGGSFDGPTEGVSADFLLTVRNCVLGDLSSRPMTASAITGGMILATNTQLAMGYSTLADIQAKFPGIDSTCLAPYHRNPLSFTVAAGDVDSSVSGGTVTMTSGAAFFLGSLNSLATRATITVAGANGSGGPLRIEGIARDAANDSGGLFAYTSTTVTSMPATVAGAAVTLPFCTRDFFPAGLTARLLAGSSSGADVSGDNLLIVDDDRFFTVGQWFQITGLPRGVGNGWYRVTEKLGSTARGLVIRVHRVIPWRWSLTNSNAYQTIAGANGARGPLVNITWPRVISLDGAGTPTGVVGTVTYVSGNVRSFNNQRAGETGRLSPAEVDAGVNAGHANWIDPAMGVVPYRIRAAAGDVIALAAYNYIEDFAPEFAGSWPHDLMPILRAGTELSRRQMGWSAERIIIGATP